MCVCAILQHSITVQYGLANTDSAEHKGRLCQQLVDMADILLDGYRTQLESIKWHLKHQSKAYTTAARYEEMMRKYEQDRALVLAPLSMFCFVMHSEPRLLVDIDCMQLVMNSYSSTLISVNEVALRRA